MCPPTEAPATNGTNGAPISKEGYTGVQTKQNPHPSHRSPYQPVGDFLSNVGRFKIIGAFRMPTLHRHPMLTRRYFDICTIEQHTRTRLTFFRTESTLREGEQFANAYFDLEAKIKIAKALDNFGVDCMKLLRGTWPANC